MDKIEHIGIAVKDLGASNALFAKLFGTPHYKVEEVESEGVKTSFFKSGPNKVELLGGHKTRQPHCQVCGEKRVREFTILLLLWRILSLKLPDLKKRAL